MSRIHRVTEVASASLKMISPVHTHQAIRTTRENTPRTVRAPPWAETSPVPRPAGSSTSNPPAVVDWNVVLEGDRVVKAATVEASSLRYFAHGCRTRVLSRGRIAAAVSQHPR